MSICEDYVTFETAKLLKEKGFDEPCYCAYKIITKPSVTHYQDKVTNSDLNSVYINIEFGSLPTLQMAMKWLRENYEIFIQPNIVFLYPIQYFATIFCYGDNLKTQQDIETERFDMYEQACEAAIKYCLENLI